jgi:hypothetical protein
MLALLPQGVKAGPAVAATTDIEAGVTSNGAESPIGVADFYLRQSHTLEFSGEDDGLALRGTLNFEQAAFRRETFEDDQWLGAELALGLQVTPDWLLRGSLAVRLGSVGDDVGLAGFALATRTPVRESHAAIEAIHAAGDTVWRFALAYAGFAYGAAEFPDLPLPATKLQADLHSLTGAAVWRRTVDAAGAVLAGVEAQMLLVPPADRLALGRFSSARLRGSIGYEARFGTWQLAAALGGDAVMAVDDDRNRVAPYAELALTAPLSDRLSLNVSGSAGVNLIDAIDGIASFERRAGVDATFTLMPGLDISAGAGLLRRQGVFDDGFSFEEASLSVGLSGTAAPGWKWRLLLDRLRHREAGKDYDASSMSLGVNGRI